MKETNSRNEILKLLCIPAVLILLSYLGFLAVKMNYAEDIARQRVDETPAYRTPSNSKADEQKKSNNQTSLKITSSKGFKKPHGAIEIEISNQNAKPLFKGQSTELVGTVTASRDVDEVDIVWHLPKGIEKLDGVQKQSLSSLRAGETQQISIRIISLVDVNQQIHLEASYHQGDLKIGNTSQYNTVDRQNAKMYSNGGGEGSKIWQ